MVAMRYVVTGGTGFIGRRVVSRLLDTRPDSEVWVLVRRQTPTVGNLRIYACDQHDLKPR